MDGIQHHPALAEQERSLEALLRLYIATAQAAHRQEYTHRLHQLLDDIARDGQERKP